LTYTRNRIREDLIPKIEKDYNPQFRSSVLRLTNVAQKNTQYMAGIVNRYWNSIVKNYDGILVINKTKYHLLDRILQDQLLLEAIIRIQGHILGVEQKHLDIFANFLQKQICGDVPFHSSLKITVTSKYIIIGNTSLINRYPKIPSKECFLRLNEKNIIGDWTVEAKPIMRDDQDSVTLNSYRKDSKFYNTSSLNLDYWPDGLLVYCNFDQVGTSLWIRTRKGGDVFNPLGISNNKKLKKFMIDSKILRVWRDSIPLVESPRGIVWVVGWRIANWAKVRGEGENWIKLQFQPRSDINKRFPYFGENDFKD
jgi:tRNA(Ile)-lysidine synthase